MKYRKPAIDRYAAIYAGILSAGYTLHIDKGTLRIEPAEQVKPMLAAHVKRHEAGLLAHLRKIERAEDGLFGKVLDNTRELEF